MSPGPRPPILRLFELRGEHCAHALLVRLPHHPEEAKQLERLVRLYGEEILRCGPHEGKLEGQYEGPLSEELTQAKGRQRVVFWLAAAREGAPWMGVPATAATEQDYWKKMNEQSATLPVHPVPPAILRRPFLLTDGDL